MNAATPFWWRLLPGVPNNFLAIACVDLCLNISASAYVHAHGGFFEPVP